MEDEIIIDTESIETFRSNAVNKSEEILSIFDDLIKELNVCLHLTLYKETLMVYVYKIRNAFHVFLQF